MTTINKYNPCIDYKPSFDREEGTMVKLKIGNREGKIRLMTGSSVEEVLYTIKAFKNKIIDLNIPTNRLNKEFMNCLGSKARDRWAKLSTQRDREGLGPFPQTEEGWEQAKADWIIEYAKDSKAKDAIISAWTSTSNYMKLKEVEVEDRADRINTICTYIDLLPGNRNILTDMEKKSLLFNSFPKTWRLEFLRRKKIGLQMYDRIETGKATPHMSLVRVRFPEENSVDGRIVFCPTHALGYSCVDKAMGFSCCTGTMGGLFFGP